MCLSLYVCRISLRARNEQQLTISKTLNINRNRMRRIFLITIFIIIIIIIRHTFRIGAVLSRRCSGIHSSCRNFENELLVRIKRQKLKCRHSNGNNTSLIGQCSHVSHENIQSSVRRIYLNGNGIYNGCIPFQLQLN